jgi:hypothetical protein
MLSEWKAGIDFLWSRRPLFILIVQVAVFGFLISSAYALTTPYVLARTGSAPTLGILTAILSVSGLVGAIVIGAWKQRCPHKAALLMSQPLLAEACNIGLTPLTRPSKRLDRNCMERWGRSGPQRKQRIVDWLSATAGVRLAAAISASRQQLWFGATHPQVGRPKQLAR